ncbi:MAG: nuclear transport factor 2 family protein [bacterium]|nr:nuclear transport factor 2 family protein [bacterium]
MRLFLSLILLVIALSSNAQSHSEQEEAILKPIINLFEAMNNADSSGIRAAFHPEVTMYTTFIKNDTAQLRKGELDNFVKAIGDAKPGMLEEKIWNFKINIDEPMAQVWCDYALYVNDEFHHCGVDAFQLINTTEGWLIFEIADTRRTEGCTEPPK